MFLWLTTAASLFGVWLNIHRKKECFVVWGATNMIWAYADFGHGLPEQGFLHAIYFGLSLHGFLSWRKPCWQENDSPSVEAPSPRVGTDHEE